MSPSPPVRLRLCLPSIDPRDIEAVTDALRSGWLSGGPRVAAFERALAARTGARHAVAVSSGTAALTLALQVAGVGPDDRVVLPAYTYPATAHAVALLGASLQLVDVEPSTWNIDPAAVRRLLSAGTPPRAVIAVDQFGLPADLEQLREAIDQTTGTGGDRPWLIDDAACALGATRRGRPCTAASDIACVSFHPRKVITTGEGGVVLLDDDQRAARLRRLRNHGRDADGRFVDVGGNQRMSELAGALGCSQLDRLDALLQMRRRLAERYEQRLAGRPQVTLQLAPPEFRHTHQTFAVCLGPAYPRQDALTALRRRGIEATIGTFAVHHQQPYATGGGAEPLAVADRLARQSIALPLHPAMSTKDVDFVCDALDEWIDDCPG